MMLGGRFDVGHDFSRVASPDLLERIHRVEAQLTDEQRRSARWTLTWLEGSPVLALDDGPTLREGGDDQNAHADFS
jgi:hypothetical protein